MKKLFQSLFFSAIILQSANLNSQVISTAAGTGSPGFSGDGGLATSAQINFPFGVIVDPTGNIYFADQANNRIRKISPAGVISTIAGTGVAGFSGDGGPATSAQLNYALGLALDAAGNLYISDRLNYRIRKINTLGIISTYAGTGVAGFSGDGGAATGAQFSVMAGLGIDAAGNLYIADQGNNRVRKITSGGVISTFAGTGVSGFSGDAGPATAAQFNGPFGILVDGLNLYISDNGNNRIRKINNSGIISTFAGTGAAGFSGDGGLATAAQLNSPTGAAMDVSGNIYIADYLNHRIRKVNPAGTISTVAGTGVAGFSGDAGVPTAAQLYHPHILSFDAIGNYYITDRTNNRIRKVTCAQPTVVASSSSSLICVGQSATLTASGGSTYTWNPGGNGSSIVVSPTVTSTYTVTGTNSVTGCSNSTLITQNVSPCTGIANSFAEQNFKLEVFPNPNNGDFVISSGINISLTLTNELGQFVKALNLSDKNNHRAFIDNLAAGVYFLYGNNGAYTLKQKIVVIK